MEGISVAVDVVAVVTKTGATLFAKDMGIISTICIVPLYELS
jgi:hypothetical protein